MSADLPLQHSAHQRDHVACPYCDAEISRAAISCRSCGRDLTPVLPLLRRLDDLEARLFAIEAREHAKGLEPAPSNEPAAVETSGQASAPAAAFGGRRRFWALPLGFAAMMAAHATVVIWLDLSLVVLRFCAIAIPFATGLVYFDRRPRIAWLDACIAILFAVVCVGAMNALLGWVDMTSMIPQGTAAWRESFFYTLSIGASMICAMLLRVTQVALSARGLTSLPRLHETLLATNGKVPTDTLKAIELTILLIGTLASAATGLVAGLLGITR